MNSYSVHLALYIKHQTLNIKHNPLYSLNCPIHYSLYTQHLQCHGLISGAESVSRLWLIVTIKYIIHFLKVMYKVLPVEVPLT